MESVHIILQFPCNSLVHLCCKFEIFCDHFCVRAQFPYIEIQPSSKSLARKKVGHTLHRRSVEDYLVRDCHSLICHGLMRSPADISYLATLLWLSVCAPANRLGVKKVAKLRRLKKHLAAETPYRKNAYSLSLERTIMDDLICCLKDPPSLFLTNSTFLQLNDVAAVGPKGSKTLSSEPCKFVSQGSRMQFLKQTAILTSRSRASDMFCQSAPAEYRPVL
eukprot:s233_g11.t1